jgi:hypothetical protein
MNRELLIAAVQDLGAFACETGDRPTGSILFILAGAMQASDFGLGEQGLGEAGLQRAFEQFLGDELNRIDRASERQGRGH